MKRINQPAIKTKGKSPTFETSVISEFSVVLPTYNRFDALERTLHALEKQTLPKELFEIIVVDDGSSDTTHEVLNQFAEHTENRFSYAVLKENGGPAQARNVGLSMIRGSVVLIIGDDIEPDSLLLEKHFYFHKQHSGEKYAMLGHVSFPEELSSSTFMNWLEDDGRNYFFNYAELESGEEAGPIFFYTCNVSVKASLLNKSGWFDESFPYASHEDLELGYRLADKGMKLVYDPTARGYHWHVLTIEGIARRVYLMGYSAEIFWRKVGDKGSGLRRMARQALTGICSFPLVVSLWNRLRKKQYLEDKDYPRQWKLLLFLGFFIGLSDSQKNRKVRL